MEVLIMQMQSIAIVLLMLTGIYFRHRRSVHIKLMSASMLWDLFLILQIELSRSAIMKASNAGTNPTSLNIHVSIAITTVILYGFMIQSGRKYLKLGLPEIRKRHRFLGWTTLIMRLLTLATSFTAVAPKA